MMYVLISIISPQQFKKQSKNINGGEGSGDHLCAVAREADDEEKKFKKTQKDSFN